jgi:hypothetical protein
MVFRTPFDFVCTCDYEEGNRVCVCMNTLTWNNAGRCSRCKEGHHRLVLAPLVGAVVEGEQQ